MSDEAGPSRTLQPSLESDDALQRDDAADEDGTAEGEQLGPSVRDLRAREGLKRLKLLDDLENQLDSLILVELATSYYLDGSTFRLIIRGLIQFFYLTPLPLVFPERHAAQPYVSAIIGTNIVCMLFHLINANPSASEAMRGYLHGGLAMDFIGTKGPVSKIHLLLLDVFILGLQLVLLSANVKRKVLKDRLKQPPPARTPDPTEAVPTTAREDNLEPNQDIDAEEQGLLRRSLSIGSAYGTQTDARSEAAGREDESHTPPNAMMDALSSGQMVIAELRIAETVRDQFRLYQDRYSSAAPSDLAAQLAGRSLSLSTRFRLNGG